MKRLLLLVALAAPVMGQTYTPFGTSCGPSLTAFPGSLPAIGTRFHALCQTTSVGLVPTLFVTSTVETPPTEIYPVAVPGCLWYVMPDIFDMRIAAFGAVVWAQDIPNNAALVGFTFVQQVGAFEPTGLTFSNPARGVIG